MKTNIDTKYVGKEIVKMFVEKEHIEDMECDECNNDVMYRLYLKEGVIYLCDNCLKDLIQKSVESKGE